jgi:hypothetical protein
MTKQSAQPYLTNHFVDDTNVQEVINQILGISPMYPFLENNPVKPVHPEKEEGHDTL